MDCPIEWDMDFPKNLGPGNAMLTSWANCKKLGFRETKHMHTATGGSFPAETNCNWQPLQAWDTSILPAFEVDKMERASLS